MDDRQFQLELVRQLGAIDEKLDRFMDGLTDHEKRLRTLEGSGGRRWEGLITSVITVAVGAFVAWIVAGGRTPGT